jgi:integrase
MKGHIRERSPGHWAIVLDTRDPATGKRKRRWHSFRGTKRQAQSECARLITELKDGTSIEPHKTTVGAFFDRWLEHMESQVAPRTHERYAEIARKNIAPFIGSVLLTKLQPATISEAYARALAEGRRNREGGLSPRTVGHMHRVLRQCLKQAVTWNLLNRNPADSVEPPKVERKKMRTLNADEAVALLEAVRPTRMFIPVLLALTCGMRRGEIVALRWRSVDLSNAQLSVAGSTEQTRKAVREKETKSGKDRTIALTGLAVEELRKHKIRQAEELLKLGIRQSDATYVVAQADGSLLKPNSLTHEFARFMKDKSMPPRVRFHELRHSHATHMLSSGVHPKVAQERLGHSSIAITLDLYSHVIPGMQEDAVARVDDALRAALEMYRGAKG